MKIWGFSKEVKEMHPFMRCISFVSAAILLWIFLSIININCYNTPGDNRDNPWEDNNAIILFLEVGEYLQEIHE